MTALRDDFAALAAQGERCDLGRAALTIARIAYPALDVDRYLAELDGLADGVRPRCARSMTPEDAVGELVAHVFETCGFHGNRDDYYDPRNSVLNDVLERRTGIPISLSVVLIETAARLGLPLEGVGFPGHFLVRVVGSAGPVLRDPFFGGRVVGDDELLTRFRAASGERAPAVPPEALERAGTPAILTRMLRNLLRVFAEREDHAHALEAADLMLVLVPDSPDELRVRGLLYERLECAAAALADLRRYLELVPEAPDADAIRGRVLRLGRAATVLH